MEKEQKMVSKGNTANSRVVNIVDCPMGCGKTSAAIYYMEHAPKNERFVYAAPYIEEGKRISEECSKVINIEEDAKSRTKTADFKANVSRGNSVACTHSLIERFDLEILEHIRKNNYTLIIDEAYEILRTTKVKERKQLFFLINHRFVTIDQDTGTVSFVDDSKGESCASICPELTNLIRTGRVKFIDKKILIWEFPVDVLDAFHKIIVMTYMMESQLMYYYLLDNRYQMNHLGVKKYEDGSFRFCSREESDTFRYDVKKLIHILDDEKLNHIGNKRFDLSSGWYERDKRAGAEKLRRLGKNIRNVQRNKFDCSTNDFMWTCFDKKGKYLEYIADKNIKKGYVPCNARAENKYKDKHYLAYGVSMYSHPDPYSYFKSRGFTIDVKKWALSSLIQWIWRSAIRDGEEIYIYIPSKYMRELLMEWIDEVSVPQKGGENG